MDTLKLEPWFIRLTNWEYWPTMAFYWPMFVVWPWLALRSRHLLFFTPVNPGIKAGGVGLESKFQTILKLPAEFRPRSVLAPRDIPFDWVREQLEQAGITYPLIAKPDKGFRGLLVRKVESEEELREILHRYPIHFVLQEFLDYPCEIGVLYHRMPGATQGHITSLTFKEFLHVTGDGQATVYELIGRQPRALLQWERLSADYAHLFEYVPAPGEKVPLGMVGNHAKGTRFINANDQIDAELEATFDRLAVRIDGFYYGRFDIKCRSFTELKEGRHFRIIELNGAFSEPTHIYDQTRLSYFEALVDVIRHWVLVRRIAARNHARGVPYFPLRLWMEELRKIRIYLRGLQ